MMTIPPSHFITMTTVTAFEQALLFMHRSNPTAPRRLGPILGHLDFLALGWQTPGKKCMHWIWLMHEGYREK